MNKIKYIIIFIALMFLLGSFVLFFFLSIELGTQASYVKPVEKALGCSIGAPEEYFGDTRIIFSNVVKGGILDKAGIKNEDIILTRNISDFVEEVYLSRNREFDFDIKRGTDILTIHITIPDFEGNSIIGISWQYVLPAFVLLLFFILVYFFFHYRKVLARYI